MSTVGTFFLVVAAFLGTVMFLVNPMTKLQKQYKGKKKSDVTEEWKQKWENEPGDVVVKGLGCCSFVLLSLSYTFVIEPLAVITALVNKIGYQPIAYIALFIVALSWLQFFLTLTKNKKSKASTGTVKTADGEKVTGDVISLDEELKFGNPVWTSIMRFFFFLPDLYLWYLFLIIIGVLR
jgi:hypothetical protein